MFEESVVSELIPYRNRQEGLTRDTQCCFAFVQLSVSHMTGRLCDHCSAIGNSPLSITNFHSDSLHLATQVNHVMFLCANY
jgi:hypothetical protein